MKEKMNFNQAQKTLGFGLTVVLFCSKLKEDFWDKLNFWQWRDIFDAAPEKSILKHNAFKKMLEKVPNITIGWKDVYNRASPTDPIKKRALRKMLESNPSPSFRDCQFILNETVEGSKIGRDTLQYMLDLTRGTSTLDRYLSILRLASPRSKVGKDALKDFSELKVKEDDFGALFEAWTSDFFDQAIKKDILAKMLELNGSFAQWRNVLDNNPCKDIKDIEDTNHVILSRMMARNDGSLGDWNRILEEFEGDNTKEDGILQKIKTLRGTFGEWEQVYDLIANEDYELKHIAKRKMMELPEDYCDWVRLYCRGCISNDDDLTKIALEKTLQLAKECKDWVWIISRAPEDSELKRIALTKLSEFTMA